MQGERWQRVTTKALAEGDVYIDYPFEDAKFRWEPETEKVYRRFYGEPEIEIPHASKLFHEAISGGWRITAEDYFQDRDTARHQEGGGLAKAPAEALTPACEVCGRKSAELRASALGRKPYRRCATCLEKGAESLAAICLKVFLEGGPAVVARNDPNQWWPHGVKSYDDGHYIDWPDILALYPRYSVHFRKNG